MKKKTLLIAIIAALLLISGCSVTLEPDSLYQVSTLQALIVGEYDGEITAEELLRYGDTGLGTFDGLDGEMIVINGKAYKARVDGTVTEVDDAETIPFANVAYISNDDAISATFENGYDDLKETLNELYPEENMPVVFSIHGVFTNIEYRSVPEQEEPYPALTEVVANQTIFYQEEIEGTLIGFRFPEFLSDINASGFHLHFISDDLTKGGHLLNVDSGDILISAETLESLNLIFPENIKDAELNVDEADVEAVEKK